MHKKLFFVLLAGSLLFTACGDTKKTTIADQLAQSYIMENAESSGKLSQRVYRASGKSVPDIAKELAEKRAPFRITESDSSHMFLLYTGQVIHVQRDPVLETDTLIEIDSTEYFTGNYSPVFLSKYIEAEDMALLFGDNWKKNAQYKKQTYYGHGDFEYRKKYPKLSYDGQYKPQTKSVKANDPTKIEAKK